MSTEAIHYLNVFLGLGVILLQVLSVVAIFLLFFRSNGKGGNVYLDFINKHFLILAFLISLFSSVFPLVYSEIIGFLACALCWWQRVFMFPTFLMFGVALWDKDRKVIRYVLPLLCFGFLISLYQNFFYYFGESSNLPCDASGVSCYQRLVSEFGGYISIPMMALTAFFALLTLLAVAHFYKKEV
ncbi:MAG: disulfide bond formation protein B [Candidatus Paceibacterota bacterium]